MMPSPRTGEGIIAFSMATDLEAPLRLERMSNASFRGVDVPGVRAPAGGFVHATVVAAGSDLVFVSGQTPEDVDGSFPSDFESQARMAWRNVVCTLAAAGCTLDDVAKVNMYIRDRIYREPNRTVRNEVLADRRPALTVLVTDHWDEGWLIEIEVIAARRERRGRVRDRG